MTKLKLRDEVTKLKWERTVEAAAQLFYDQGYEKTTLDAVAGQLGVAKPFIYTHFKSKADLLAEICTRGVNASLVAIDDALLIDTTPTEKLRCLSRNFVLAVLDNQLNIAILLREEKHLEPQDLLRLSNLRRQFDSKLLALLELGRAEGSFRLSDPDVAALSIGGIVSWAHVWYRPQGRLDRETLAEEIAQLILAMVGVTR